MFGMAEPLAFLLTFRTYGTWLHGDERGSVDGEHNGLGMPLLDPNPRRVAYERSRMSAPPLELDEPLRRIVDAAIVDQCRYRNWELIERAVRSNHVHIVIGYAGVRPERMAGELKSRATRWLRERGHVAANQPVWVDGPGSRRYLWRLEEIAVAAAYVREGQDVPR
jgi:REP element-mobilizing transposase RayT